MQRWLAVNKVVTPGSAPNIRERVFIVLRSKAIRLVKGLNAVMLPGASVNKVTASFDVNRWGKGNRMFEKKNTRHNKSLQLTFAAAGASSNATELYSLCPISYAESL